MRSAPLIFDLDGTLFQTESATVPAVQDTFRDAGLEVSSTELILDFIGSPMSELAKWVQSVCGDRDADELMRLIDAKEMALAKSIGQLFPKVIDVLESLHRDYEALAICTNGGPEYAGTIIDSQGIRHFFDVVRCRANELDNKPAIVAEIIGNLGLTEGVVTGDRREDVEAAKRNSLRAMRAGYGYGSEDELKDADAVAHAASEMPDLITQVLDS